MISYFEQLSRLQKNAYAPYSNYCVAALLILEDGQQIAGVNVENCSYGGTICAERSAFVSAISQFGRSAKFKQLHLLAGNSHKLATPCGICRQFISELVTECFPIIIYNSLGHQRRLTMQELLPYSFSKKQLV